MKGITTRDIFRLYPEVKKQLWGGGFCIRGFNVNSLGRHSDEDTVEAYVKVQGSEKEYKKIHHGQLKLF